MIINIVAAGPAEVIPKLNMYDNEQTKWLGVDDGVNKIISAGIKPHYACGDFDSVTKEQLLAIEREVGTIEKFPSEKNETDLELGIRFAINLQPHLINIFGATDGRLDHLFANLFLIKKYSINNQNIKINLIDKTNITFVKTAGHHQMMYDERKKYVSFIPLSNKVSNLTLTHFKYPLKNHDLPLSSTLCISNELISKQGYYSFTDGILLVVRSND